MKIGIDGRAAKWYRGTGIGTYSYQLINNLSKIDSTNDYTIFMPKNSNLNLNTNFYINEVPPISNNSFWEEVRIPNNLTKNKLDIYHIPQNGVGLSSNIQCAKVITLHDIIPLKMPETVSDKYLKIFNTEMPRIIENCDGILTVSQFSKEDISEAFNFPKEKIFVTYLGAEDIYKPMNKIKCKNLLKKDFGIKKDFLLYVGGFSPRKNILGIIESFSLLPYTLRKSLNLIITGRKGISYEIYKIRTQELNVDDSVLFTDFVPLSTLAIFYNAAEMLIYPSLYEGFGLPPLEAMACGTPVIASSLTSIPEVCKDSAILINPYDVHQLKDSIESLLLDNSLKSSLIQKGFNTISKYSWENTAISTLESYKYIIKS